MAQSTPNLILALLLLSTACPAAGASVMRVHSNGGVEAMQTESVTELANMFSDDLEAKTMASKLLEGTPSDDILSWCQDGEKEIKRSNDEARATLAAAFKEIASCDDDMNNGMDRTMAKHNGCSEESTSHTGHRTDESNKFTIKEHWEAETAEKKEVMTTECNAFQAVEDEAKSATASYGGGDEGAYLESVSQQFCKDLLPRYREHKERCTTAKAEHVRVSEIYKTKKTAYTLQKTKCDGGQTEMDETCCEYSLATKGVCKSYDTCYEDKVEAYKTQHASIQADVRVMEVEWRVYERVLCLVPLLGSKDTAGIMACKTKVHDWSHLKIEARVPPGKSACHVDEAFPGTDAYYTTHFGNLPENAKGKDVAECAGMMEDESPQQQTGQPQLPSWFRESNACYLEYCNAYVDLKKAFCCPPGVSREKLGNGGMYCSENHDCTSPQQAASCKNHMFSHGLREGRVKEEKFSMDCDKTTPSPQEGEGGCSRPKGCKGSSCAIQCDRPAGYYSDPNDCGSYCKCTGSNAPSRYETCNSGLLWDTKIDNCNWDYNVKCGERVRKSR